MLSLTVLPTRWGYIIGGINETCTFAGTTVATRANNIDAQYNTYAAQREVTNDLYGQMVNVQNDLGDWSEFLAGLMMTTLSTMSRDDTTRPATDDLDGLFEKLNRDMVSQAGTWERPTVTGTVAAANILGGSNIGDGYLISSVIEPIDGVSCYYAHAEVVRAVATSTSYDDSATFGSETFSVQGETSVDQLDPRWPKGSGLSTETTAVDPDTAGILTDGRLDVWTDATTLTNWSKVTVGTAMTRATSSPDPYSLLDSDGGTNVFYPKFTGDAATIMGIYQILSQDIIKANTNIAVQFWHYKVTGTMTGSLRVSLTNSAGTVLTDNAGNSISTVISSGSFVAAWTRAAAVFTLPKNLPSEVRLEFRFANLAGTGALLDNGTIIGLDFISLAEMERTYVGGPYIKIFSGATGFALNDGFTDTIANNKTTTSFVRSLDRLFKLKEEDIRLQTAVSFTIPDASFIF